MDRGLALAERLWRLSSESAWTPQDMRDPEGGCRVLSRYLTKLLKAICDEFSEVQSAYAAISGIEPSIFKPLACVGRSLSGITATQKFEANTVVGELLLKNTSAAVLHMIDPQTNGLFKGDPHFRSKAIIKLRSIGELFGFISLDTNDVDAFTPSFLREIEGIEPPLSRVTAESVFSMRVWGAALPFEKPGEAHTRDGLYHDIARRTLVAFAACGAVLRIYEPATGRMVPAAVEGSNLSNRIMNSLRLEGSIGEVIAQQVYNDSQYDWALGMVSNNHDPSFSGSPVSENTKVGLANLGIKAFCVVRLDSEIGLLPAGSRVGTLSFFHRDDRQFSWRDLTLARSLARRAADLIAFFVQNEELGDAHHKLQRTYDILSLEYQKETRVDILSLLSHDLGHKAFSVQNTFEEYVNNVRKIIRDGRPFNALDPYQIRAKLSIDQIRLGLANINQLFPTGSKNETDPLQQKFNLKELVSEAFGILEAALGKH